jgi:hypothetical protein
MRRYLISLLAILALPACALSQTGFPPFASIDRSRFDSRNDQNMNVNFGLPIMASPGRGMTLNLSAFYNSLTWVPKNIAGTIYWTIAPQGNFGWQLNSPIGNTSYQYSSTRTRCGFVDGVATYTYVYTYSNYVYVDPYGTQHTFNIYQQETVNNCTGSDTFQGTYTGYANDLSGLFASIAVDPTNPVVTTKSGIAITNTTQTDTNGNYISSSSPSGETDWTDSAGRLALKIIGGNTSTQYKFYDPTGAYQTTTLNLQTFNIKTNFGCSGVVEYNNTAVLPVSLVLPNNQAYQFTYEPTPGNSGYYTGRLQRITLPTGGYYEYDYTGANDGINCADGTTLSMNRVVSE